MLGRWVELCPKTECQLDCRDDRCTTLGEFATVLCVDPKATIELRGIDVLTNVDEIKTAIDKALERSSEASEHHCLKRKF